eukprot:TRINITY_DN2506_c0_g1_i1.p1 TRINITY_DN2506_c0_g1~~TRINITY_DN2506_c0_g1_i1.p1  ORF type:complete len:217 (-),score=11.17 TRINITY_DN2506_c0_g1_i1:1628-2278(-)
MSDADESPPPSRSSKGSEKRRRTTFNANQRQMLESQFAVNPYPDKTDRKRLASELRVKDSSITWWFGHRRAKEVKTKKPGSHSDNEVASSAPAATSATRNSPPPLYPLPQQPTAHYGWPIPATSQQPQFRQDLFAPRQILPSFDTIATPLMTFGSQSASTQSYSAHSYSTPHSFSSGSTSVAPAYLPMMPPMPPMPPLRGSLVGSNQIPRLWAPPQ